jgi:hypothetical protein
VENGSKAIKSGALQMLELNFRKEPSSSILAMLLI